MICSYPFQVLLYCLLTFGLGSLTGLSEILPRYRDDPWRAAFCRHGVIYWVINGVVSWLVFFVAATVFWERLGLIIAGEINHVQMLKVALISGVGAMALLRSKLFKITLKDGAQYSVGPDHIVEALLNSTNDYIDKFRAQKRTELVKRKFTGLDYGKLRPRAGTLIFGGRQTLSEGEEKEFGETLAKIDSSDVPEDEKVLQLGYKILDYLGEDFVDKLKLEEFERRPEEKQGAGGESVGTERGPEKTELIIKRLRSDREKPPPGGG